MDKLLIRLQKYSSDFLFLFREKIVLPTKNSSIVLPLECKMLCDLPLLIFSFLQFELIGVGFYLLMFSLWLLLKL